MCLVHCEGEVYTRKMDVTHLMFVLIYGSNYVHSAFVQVPKFNDPKFKDQFYLNEQYGVTMNIYKAWNKGFTGKGVTICIHDPTGVEKENDELASKFILKGSFNFETNLTDPKPQKGGPADGINAHGTMMAGLAAAKQNNGMCGVGVAYDASVSGIKLILPKSLDSSKWNETIYSPAMMQFGKEVNDIYSCSWGTIGMWQANIGYMSLKREMAIRNATEKGRGGRGNIYVFSIGNGGLANGTCSYNEYVTSIHTIGIAVVTGKNVRSYQNVRCSAVSAVTYSRDGALGIDYPHDLMPTCGNRNTCAKSSAASSAAAAVASGIIALVLQANPNLGWRDVQHLIARSSCSQFTSVPWKTNKAGIRVSDDFGFGLMDAEALTTNAKNWSNVGQQIECIISSNAPQRMDGVATILKTVNLISWPASCGGEGKRINFLEHVVLEFSLNFTLRKNVEIDIESPGGTKSTILRSGRRFDVFQEIKNLSTMSLHFWGENPRGAWLVKVRNVKPDPTQNGTLSNWALKFYGTMKDPLAGNKIVGSQIMRNQTNTASPPTAISVSSATLSTKSQPSGTAICGFSPMIIGLLINMAILLCQFN